MGHFSLYNICIALFSLYDLLFLYAASYGFAGSVR